MDAAKTVPKLLRYEAEVPKDFSGFDPKTFAEGVWEWADSRIGRRGKAAVSVSGGVDSTTVAYLLKPLGNRLYPFFIDDGLRRTIRGVPEADVTAAMFRDFPNFEVLRTADVTLPALEGLRDGRRKREAMIGTYVGASNAHIEAIGANFVADGTIKPDIETTASGRQRQHNLNLPYGATKIEPVAPLYKPHVRRLGMHLGLPSEFAHKIPCPGPAMLLRVGGEFTRKKLEVARTATDVFEQAVETLMLAETGATYKFDSKTGIRTPFQYFAYVLGKGSDEIDAVPGVLPRNSPSAICYRTHTQAMWIDPSVGRQRGELYAPVLWVSCEAGIPDYEMLDAMRAEADKHDYPRMVIELANGGDGFPVVFKCVQSADAMTATTMKLDQDYLSAVAGMVAENYRCPVGCEISRKPRATIELF